MTTGTPIPALSAAQNTARAAVAARMPMLSEGCATIFDLGESAWREYRSAAWYVERLRAEGFAVEEGSAGMPTAFCAEWSNGPGPVIGLYAEYDGVPGNCQAAVPRRAPREGLGYQAAGHTDPHSGLGMAAFGGLLATRAAMERHGIAGGLRFTGEPAEKVRGSKPIHAARGYYDGLAAILSFHPFYMLPLCNTVRWDTHCGAACAMVYRFLHDAPAGWARHDGAPIPQFHTAGRAPGANDALNLMYLSSKVLRDSTLPHQGGWSVSEAILTAGQATADNLPAGLAEIQYLIRASSLDMAESMTAALDRNAEASAAMTGCRWERHWVCKSRPGLANHAMARVVWGAMQALGAPRWREPAKAVAREIQAGLGLDSMAEPFIDEIVTTDCAPGRRGDPAARSGAVPDPLDLGRLHRDDVARADRALLRCPARAEGAARLRLSGLGDERPRRHSGDHRSDGGTRGRGAGGVGAPAAGGPRRSRVGNGGVQ